jgi:hypothetical protein
MSRITTENVAATISEVKCISLPQKEKLAEEIHRRQPYLLASCVVQPKLGAHVNDVEFLLNILLVFYQALCRPIPGAAAAGICNERNEPLAARDF